MKKLETLISQLCPDGVPFFALKDVLVMERGTSATKNNLKPGDIPVISGGKVPAFYCDVFNRTGETITVAGSGAGAGYVQFWTCPIFVNDAFSIKTHENLNIRFVYHFLLSVQDRIYSTKKGGGVPHVHISSIEDFKIPVPPLEIQNEIVRVLDDFTEFTTELTTELAAELAARKMQYEFYRDALLSFDDSVPLVPLGEVSVIARGASPRPIKQFITTEQNGVNWIKIGDVKQGTKYITSTNEKITKEGARHSRLVKPGDFILSNSMSFGRPYILSIEGCIHDGWLSISGFEQTFIPDFLYHLLNCSTIQTEMKQKASFGGAVQNLNADIVRGIKLPVLSLEKQKAIVGLLDRFVSFTTDISQDLTAEIESRKKQYEHYRNLLLSFKECQRV